MVIFNSYVSHYQRVLYLWKMMEDKVMESWTFMIINGLWIPMDGGNWWTPGFTTQEPAQAAAATVSHVIHWPHSSSHLLPWPQGSVNHPEAAQNVHRCTGAWPPDGPQGPQRVSQSPRLRRAPQCGRASEKRFDVQRWQGLLVKLSGPMCLLCLAPSGSRKLSFQWFQHVPHETHYINEPPSISLQVAASSTYLPNFKKKKLRIT